MRTLSPHARISLSCCRVREVRMSYGPQVPPWGLHRINSCGRDRRDPLTSLSSGRTVAHAMDSVGDCDAVFDGDSQ